MIRSGLRAFTWCLLSLSVALTLSMDSSSYADDTDQATRQFAVAVGFQNQKLFDSAIDEWKLFLTKHPTDSRIGKAAFYLGTCQLQAKQYLAASATFESVIQKHPKLETLDQAILNLGSAHFGLAEESGDATDYAKAKTHFSRLIGAFPRSEFLGRAYYFQGECLYHQQKLADAAESYSQLVKQFPTDELAPDGLYALGICHEAMKQPKAAQETFAKFEDQFSKHPLVTEVRMRQAELLFSAGEFESAVALFAKVSAEKEFAFADTAMLRQARCLYELKKFEDAASLYWNVPRQFAKSKHYDTAVLAGAKCYYLIGKYAQARSGLENVAKRDVPEAAEASQWIARSLLKEKNPEQALTILDAAIEKHAKSPSLPKLTLAKVDALYEIPGRRPETVPLYAEFARKYPKEELAPQAQYMAALTALEVEDNAAAKKHCEAFIRSFPEDKLLPDVKFIAAEARLLLREFSEAEKFYRDFLKLAPSHSNATQAGVRLGMALQLAGKTAEARRELEATLAELQSPALKSEALAIVGRCLTEEKQFEKAAGVFEQSLKAKPDREQSDQTLLALADVYRKTNRPADAVSKLDQIKTQFPASPLIEEATFRKGEVLYEKGDFDQSVGSYSKVVTTWPDGTFAPHAQYGLGWSYFKQNKFEEAIKAVSLLTELYPKSELASKGLYIRAMANFQLGSFDAAVSDAKAFLAGGPSEKDKLDAQYLMGLALAAQQKFADAVKFYELILAANGKYSDADKVLYELGWAHHELGHQVESVAAFRRLASDFPDSTLAAESLFRVGESWYDSANFSESAKAYSDTIAKAGQTELGEKAAHKLAWSLLKAEKTTEASAAFDSQLKSFPKGTLAGDAVFLLGECSFKQKQWEPAMDRYASVIKDRHPTYHALATYRSGECAAALEDWGTSLKFHQSVLESFSDFELLPEARYGAGWALQQQGKLTEAVALYEKVTEETETETAAKARFMIGECYFAQKQHKDATKHFLKAAFAYGHKEWSAMAWLEAARCFEILKDVPQAKNCYTQMIEKYPDHSKVTEARKRLAEL